MSILVQLASGPRKRFWSWQNGKDALLIPPHPPNLWKFYCFLIVFNLFCSSLLILFQKYTLKPISDSCLQLPCCVCINNWIRFLWQNKLCRISLLFSPCRTLYFFVFIGHECSLVAYWLTHWCFRNMTDVTLAFEDANSIQFLMLIFLMMLMMRQVLATVWSRFGSWNLVESLKLNFGQYVEPDVWSRFWRKNLVKIFKLNFAQDFEAEVLSRFWGWSLIKIPKLKFGIYSEAKFWCYLKAVTLVKGLYPRVRGALALF